MKKAFLFLLVIGLGMALTGCLPKMTDTSKSEVEERVYQEVSDDDSLKTIEEEINDTELDEFEAELDALDEEINQL